MFSLTSPKLLACHLKYGIEWGSKVNYLRHSLAHEITAKLLWEVFSDHTEVSTWKSENLEKQATLQLS